jgi:Zinc carboxypeptidase
METMLTRVRRHTAVIATLMLVAASAAAQTITTPKQQFGFNIGDDYQLATYTQFVEYWHKLDKESDRMKVVEIGKTAEGRPHLMAIVTSPENHKKLERYKEISRKLALAEGLTDDQARALAKEGKCVVWIDGGLHATEVLGAHQLIETVYQLVSRTDAETTRVLNDCIVLAVHANPDGMELVSSWYMRNPVPEQRGSGPGIPRLYEKYAGHDNNRDFYMSNLPESTNMNKVLYTEWFPQIMYNHHQTGPAGTVMFAPPFRDPFNYNFDPLIVSELDLVGAAMASRFNAEGKPGVTSRRGSNYSTWWNGGLRTTVYFHNMIGLLTETIGNPTPVTIPFLPSKQLPDSSLHLPIEPQVWHFRQSIDYSLTANWAVLDIASRNKDNFLYNIYQMGKNSIERGSKDSWTATPRRVIAAQAALGDGRGGRGGAEAAAGDEPSAGGGRGGRGGTPEQFKEFLRNPANRDPRGFILPADQPDFPTAAKFINALLKTGVTVHRATAAFTAAGKNYPAGSYVVKAAQAFRPHVLDMFEPQDHPDDIPYPGGPPTRPYDNAGWTLAYQMGVQFDRILDGFDGPFEKVTGLQSPAPGKVADGNGPLVLSHAPNNAFIAVNRLLAAGREVLWTQGDKGYFYIPQAASIKPELQKLATDLGVTFEAPPSALATGGAIKLRKLRVALADQYGGSMPSGWTRFLLEQFEFPFEVVYPKALDAGNLSARFDVIIFPSGVGPAGPGGGFGGRGGRGGGGGENAAGQAPAGRGGQGRGGGDAGNIPAEYQNMVGAYSAAQTMPQLKKFLEDGGTILAVGRSAMSLAQLLQLPIGNHLSERSPDGVSRALPTEKYYVPGSVLRAAVNNASPIAHGIANPVDVFFDNSPVFELGPQAALQGIRPVAWFDSPTPLRSGWAYGQGYLQGGVAIVDASVGKGKLFMFGPEITFRAQPHGTFKFLFNGIYLGARASAANTTTDSASRQR